VPSVVFVLSGEMKKDNKIQRTSAAEAAARALFSDQCAPIMMPQHKSRTRKKIRRQALNFHSPAPFRHYRQNMSQNICPE
jgi:hypothetical protein